MKEYGKNRDNNDGKSRDKKPFKRDDNKKSYGDKKPFKRDDDRGDKRDGKKFDTPYKDTRTPFQKAKEEPAKRKPDRYKSIERERPEKEVDKSFKRDGKMSGKKFGGAKPRFDSRDKPRAFYGVVELNGKEITVRPTARQQKFTVDLTQKYLNNAEDGEIVFVSRVEEELTPYQREKLKKQNKKPRLGPYAVKQRLGSSKDVRNYSLLSLLEAGLQPNFPPKIVDACKGLEVPELGDREDLRDLPLVTIDGEDARDFDDAVYCRPDDVNGGYYAIIAIADVAHYVREGTPLDSEAYRRGNSTYFPDRVVPMLPEGLSNDLCSLRPNEDRACMHVHVWIDEKGQICDWNVGRGLMRSHARLTYNQVQRALDGQPDDDTTPVLEQIQHLYKGFQLLLMARKERGALEIETIERQIFMDNEGGVKAVLPKERLEAHQLIEEYMITANVVVAHALEAKNAPCMYRVHDNPSAMKIMSLREFIKPLNIDVKMHNEEDIDPSLFNEVLAHVKDHPELAPVINMLVLRSQSQAVYSPDNLGHFGLALDNYAHFTSPIRRYADLINHRSLISAYGLGDDGLDENAMRQMEEWGEYISTTERASMVAERSCVDRFTTHFLQNQVGQELEARIVSVTNFGLFVSLLGGIGEALIPMRLLPQDYYDHHEDQHVLVGGRTGLVYRLGGSVTIMVLGVDPILGSVTAQIVGESSGELPGFTAPKSSGRGRNDDKGRPTGPRGKSGGGKRDFKKPFKERDDKKSAKRGQTNKFKDGGGKSFGGKGGNSGSKFGGKGKKR